MKIVRIQGHLREIQVPITNEEYDLLLKFKDGATLPRRDLTEREAHIANMLTIKDVLHRKNQDGNITYKKKTLS